MKNLKNSLNIANGVRKPPGTKGAMGIIESDISHKRNRSDDIQDRREAQKNIDEFCPERISMYGTLKRNKHFRVNQRPFDDNLPSSGNGNSRPLLNNPKNLFKDFYNREQKRKVMI